MTDLVYVIEQIWVDPSENSIAAALGYNSLGFVSEEQKAIDFCSKGRDYTSEDCWAIGIVQKNEKLPEYRYKSIKKLE